MPAGTCDPASRGDEWNEGAYSVPLADGGVVSVTYQYGWDGVSVRPNCNGPLNSLSVQNTSTTLSGYAHFKGRRGHPRVIEIPPGFSRTFNQRQLSQRGIEDYSDLDNFYLTDSPDPPPWDARKR